MADQDVGITEFTDPYAPSVHGVIKERFSDFVVREIDLNGVVCYLHTINDNGLEASIFGSNAPDTNSSNNDEEGKYAAFIEAVRIVASASVDNTPEDKLVELQEIIAKCVNQDESCPSEWIGFPCTDKASRGGIHQAVKKELSQYLDSDTSNIEGVSYIRLLPKHKNKGANAANKRRRVETWPKNCGDFLEFTLLKENIDTMSAVNILTKHMHLKTNAITYNGTKDKRGITAQKCTVYRKKPSDFRKINTYPHNPIMRIGDFQYVHNPARLGQLKGNQFEITLRDIQCDNVSIERACNSLKTRGFVNYFGLQRFGKGSSKSHVIGKEIFLSHWKSCIDLLFTPKEGDKDQLAQAKVFYQEGNFKECLDMLPEALHSEKNVVKRLLVAPLDRMSAFQSISKNTRLICAHAYQSYVWNKAVSKRLRVYGLNVVEGDLVAKHSSVAPIAHTSHISEDLLEEEDIVANTAMEILLVTKEDLEQGVYSMKDVVLPLVGSESLLPSHSVAAFITLLLSEDGLDLHSFTKCEAMYRMKGSYRKIIQSVEDLEYNIVQYDIKGTDLHHTELDNYRIQGNQTNSSAGTAELDGQGGSKALKLKFSLPSGCYATMLLRELTKESTESDFQAMLSSNA